MKVIYGGMVDEKEGNVLKARPFLMPPEPYTEEFLICGNRHGSEHSYNLKTPVVEDIWK